MRLLWAAAGFAAGYVMGSKAGRERYEQIRRITSDLWSVVDTMTPERGETAADTSVVTTGLTPTDPQPAARPPAMATPQAQPIK